MTKTSNIFKLWEESFELIQENYPGLKYKYFENVYHASQLSFEKFSEVIKQGKPLDYISQQRNFVGYDFYVDERVLIPRFETELLYEMALAEIKSNVRPCFKLAEVGVGSGCLGLSILADSPCLIEFTATDISQEATEVFHINHDLIQKEFSYKHRINVVQTDRLNSIKCNHFDLIVSNPPYIKSIADRGKVHITTLNFEPHIALFIDVS